MAEADEKIDGSSEYRQFIEKILKPELEAIGNRRRKKEFLPVNEDLFGVALSGGGIRSASFSLGVLQALNVHKLIERIDYLSTVSGGGYIGASVVKAMSEKGGEFPYATNEPNEFSDSLYLMHLRNYARFLIPNGIGDVFLSAGVIIRGLFANLVMVLSFILFSAAVTLWANPTESHLGHSLVHDWLTAVGVDPQNGVFTFLLMWSSRRFAITQLLLVVGIAFFAVWAIIKSQPKDGKLPQDIDSGIAYLGKRFVVFFLIVFVIEANSWVLEYLITSFGKTGLVYTGFWPLIVAIAGYVGSAVAFREKIVSLISESLGAKTKTGLLKAMFASVALFIAGLILPVLIYVLYAFVVFLGIQPSRITTFGTFVFSNGWVVSLLIIVGIMLALLVPYWRLVKRDPELTKSWSIGVPTILFAVVIFWFLPFSSLGYVPTAAKLYFVLFSATALLVLCFAPNSNSLHGLYRDRLRKTFLTRPNTEQKRTFFHELDLDAAPFLIMNCALNARLTSATNKHLRDAIETDPARRGRKAEIFFFSPTAFGSASTGYVHSDRLKGAAYNIDLATAMAISGAAASSSMGKGSLGVLTATLALLNIRLGYWLKNPRYDEHKLFPLSKPSLEWWDKIGLHVLMEVFGLLRMDSPKIYLTDGGHIENLGLYQLLKRRCRYIILAEAECDKQYTFAALSDLERYARIDLGIRINMDWKHVAMQGLADDDGRKPDGVDPKFCHFAVGKILYPPEFGKPAMEGTLLYLKAVVTGDEADYVLDYKRRYPDFPQETTLDQFFSEDQMEAYRALGFHSLDVAFSPREIGKERMAPEQSLIGEMKKQLHVKLG